MRKLFLFCILFIAVSLQTEMINAKSMDMDALPEVQNGTAAIERESRADWQARIGLGAGMVPDYEGSNDYQVVPSMYARIHWKSGYSIELEGLALRANLLPNDMWNFGPVVRYRMGREDVENSAVDRMRDIDDSFEAGAFAKIVVDNWNARLDAVMDIADGHDGYLISIHTGYTILRDSVWRVSAGVSATYADDNYMETYFSVDGDNSDRSGLAAYEADAGFKDIGATLSANYSISKNWGLMGIIGYKRLLGDAEDSPIVDKEGSPDQFMSSIAITYRWY
jgi:outer membrane protein